MMDLIVREMTRKAPDLSIRHTLQGCELVLNNLYQIISYYLTIYCYIIVIKYPTSYMKGFIILIPCHIFYYIMSLLLCVVLV